MQLELLFIRSLSQIPVTKRRVWKTILSVIKRTSWTFHGKPRLMYIWLFWLFWHFFFWPQLIYICILLPLVSYSTWSWHHLSFIFSEFCIFNDVRYTPLNYCLPLLPSSDLEYSWPKLWPDRLSSRPLSTELKMDSNSSESIEKDSNSWVKEISSVYFRQLGVNWSGVRNIMDMNAGYGG